MNIEKYFRFLLEDLWVITSVPFGPLRDLTTALKTVVIFLRLLLRQLPLALRKQYLFDILSK